MLAPAAAYFGLVFAAGFALGVARTLWLVDWVGERSAELAELPLMVFLSWLAARYVVRRWPPASTRRALCVGGVALGLLLLCELTVVLGLRGLSLSQYLATRDPVAGTAYLVSLLWFGLWPAWLTRKSARSGRPAGRR